MYKCGTLVLIPFPFTDLTSSKLRPALILSKKVSADGDIIVCFITSKVEKKLSKSDMLIDERSRFFQKSGLKIASVIKFNKVATLNKRLIIGELGTIPKSEFPKLRKHLLAALGI